MTFSPTPEQAAIVDFIKANPTDSLMVSARAGAAKTSTILLASHEIAEPFLALAFNVRIKKELEERLPPHATCKTMNGLGHQAWGARLGKRLQLDADKMYRLAKEIVPVSKNFEEDSILGDVLALARKAKSVGLIPDGAPRGKTSIWPDIEDSWDELGWQVGVMHVTDEIIIYARQLILASIKEAFKGVVDFDDQIVMSVMFGGIFPKYPTVIVDESQDLSYLNHLMLRECVGTRLIAIGDPYQAIYAFRGADTQSMANMGNVVGVKFSTLSLTYSFRCPHSVAVRQTQWVADFKSFHTCPEGTIEVWPGLGATPGWSLDSIPPVGAIICRNNAPLMKLAFALIKARRPVKILGRDIGISLAALLKKIAGKGKGAGKTSVEDMFTKVAAWAKAESAKVGNSESKLDLIADRKECLEVLLDASGAATVTEACEFIKNLFSNQAESLVLSSGHRSKGLEWDWVMHLDPWRIPSKQAQNAAQRGNDGPMQQERNLNYVIETRTKKTLVLASLSECEEIGKAD